MCFRRSGRIAALAAIRGLIKRRQAGESVAYLLGKKEFWGQELAVDAVPAGQLLEERRTEPFSPPSVSTSHRSKPLTRTGPMGRASM